MTRSFCPLVRRQRSWFTALEFAFIAVSLLSLSGCQKTFQVTDSRLKPIQQMIDEQLPSGSTTDRVNTFLATRGYATEIPQKPGTIVAIIRHIDTERVEPVTARVTFYFDANGKLNNVEIIRTMNQVQP
jgi:hypothetical protein